MLAGFFYYDFVKLLRAYPSLLLVKLLLKLYGEFVIAFFGHQSLDFIKLISINLSSYKLAGFLQSRLTIEKKRPTSVHDQK